MRKCGAEEECRTHLRCLRFTSLALIHFDSLATNIISIAPIAAVVVVQFAAAVAVVAQAAVAVAAAATSSACSRTRRAYMFFFLSSGFGKVGTSGLQMWISGRSYSLVEAPQAQTLFEALICLSSILCPTKLPQSPKPSPL